MLTDDGSCYEGLFLGLLMGEEPIRAHLEIVQFDAEVHVPDALSHIFFDDLRISLAFQGVLQSRESRAGR